MLPSASRGAKTAMYEPSHGSAPDIAGKGVANPLATILSVAMMLRHSFDMAAEADLVEKAVRMVLKEGFRTLDIRQAGARIVGTTEMGGLVVERLRALFSPLVNPE
jgi:3-isopropylmalate dehydrogenase